MGPKKTALVFALLFVPFADGAPDRSFHLMETSIADIHKAMQAGTLTCHDLVQQYLDRIHAYDQQGPAIDSMLYINPASLQAGRRFRSGVSPHPPIKAAWVHPRRSER